MMRVITIRPSADGWEVRDGGASDARRFASGAEAEAEARRMLKRLGQVGVAAELRIYLMGGGLAGRFIAQVGILERA
jgi:hypothetical protein